jgi:hypothetical protein
LKYLRGKCKTLTSLTKKGDTVKVDFNILLTNGKKDISSLQQVFKAERSKESKKVESVEEEPSDLPF